MIDDDAELCQEMTEILTDEGYSVESARDGAQGKIRLAAKNYDLVILDYRMPTSDGVEVLKFIKEKNISNPKIFVVSGRPFIEKIIKDQGLSNIVTCIINKPFSINALLVNIKNALGSKPDSPACTNTRKQPKPPVE